MIIEIVTACATIATNSSSMPQVIKTIKSRKTRDLSLPFMLQLLCGLSLWCVYGILRQDMIFLAGNIAGMTLWIILLFMKLRNMRAHKDG